MTTATSAATTADQTTGSDGMATLHFTTDWFSHNIPVWQHYLNPLAGKENIAALEIGCWEGRATTWLLTNILTHPTSSITCVDTFTGNHEHKDPNYANSLHNLEQRFRANVDAIGCSNRVHVVPVASDFALCSFYVQPVRPQFDIIYIDGSHMASDVLSDAVLAFKMLNRNGLLIFDDYGWSHPTSTHPKDSPKAGIDAFCGAYTGLLSVIHVAHQVIIQKM